MPDSGSMNCFDQADTKLKILAPCFNELLRNENMSYIRTDLSYNHDLTRLVNTENEAKNSKLGLFLKSLNRGALCKNGHKDIWSLDLKSMWMDLLSASVNKKKALIHNSSFRLWMANVHDFYKCNGVDLNDVPGGPKQSNFFHYFFI